MFGKNPGFDSERSKMLFYYADFAVVSSFHGTAFSINFQKEFLTVAPNRFNSRVASLLELTGLRDRIVSSETVDVGSLKPIDYNKVNACLEAERNHSKAFLSGLLK